MQIVTKKRIRITNNGEHSQYLVLLSVNLDIFHTFAIYVSDLIYWNLHYMDKCIQPHQSNIGPLSPVKGNLHISSYQNNNCIQVRVLFLQYKKVHNLIFPNYSNKNEYI